MMVVSTQLQQAWAEESDFIVYSQNNILTIYKLQTEDTPFLAGGAKFLITPNPFSYTAIMNDSRYDPEFDTSALLVTDNDPLFDSDPTDGIIELAGVKPGAYSVTEISGPAGFITNDNPAFGEIEDDRIATEFSSVQIFSIPINYTSTVAVNIEPPTVNSSSLAKLQSFAAKVNGVDIGTGNLPPAIITNNGAGSGPSPVIFGNPVNGQQSATALFDSLGIPTYASPSEASFGNNSNSTYRLPPFIASDSGGGKVVFTPKLDKTFSGLNVNLDLSGQDLGLAKVKVDSLNIPIGADGVDVGFKVKIQDQVPSGLPASPMGDAAFFMSIDTTGGIDFGNSASFTSPPTIKFSVNRDFAGFPHTTDGCPDARLYLRDPGTNTWKIQAPPTRNPSGDTTTSCSFTQLLPHFSDYVVAGNNGSGPDSGHDHGGSGGSGGGSGGHSGHSGGGSSSASHSDHDVTAPLSTFSLSKATVNIGSISLKNTQGSVLAGAKVGQQVRIASTVTNVLQEHQPYAFIVQTVDENGFTTSVSWVSGHLDPSQILEQSRSWTPDHAGTYEVSVMVWNGVMQSPQSLADKVTARVEVVVE
ncbi:MAG: hypothetical protein ABI348_06145 [Nitrososphaera sp.]